MENPHTIKSTNKILKAIHLSLVVGLFTLIFLVIRPFIVPLLWSLIFAIFLIPAFNKLNTRLSGRNKLSAFIITISAFTFFLFAVIPLFWKVANELIDLFKYIEAVETEELEHWLAKIQSVKIIGPAITDSILTEFNGTFPSLYEFLKQFKSTWITLASNLFTNIVSLLFGGFFSILSLYFLLAYSTSLVKQIQRGALILGGSSYLELVVSAYETIHATIYGILLTALAQGTLAGLAYISVGVSYPILLAIITAFFSFIPFGPPFIYLPIAFFLWVGGASWVKILIFLLWCVTIVSTVDNVLRPLFISRTTKLSFLLVLFGIIGGVASFGPVGLFIGPVTMVVAVHLWSNLLKNGESRV
jgi:predicted PurR-regulated permease PerM